MNEREDELFEDWWESEGQYHRAGGGQYEKTFAYHAWMAVINREGYKLVPVEPSKSCLKNLGDVIFDNFGTTNTEVDRCAEEAYKAMIGAVE